MRLQKIKPTFIAGTLFVPREAKAAEALLQFSRRMAGHRSFPHTASCLSQCNPTRGKHAHRVRRLGVNSLGDRPSGDPCRGGAPGWRPHSHCRRSGRTGQLADRYLLTSDSRTKRPCKHACCNRSSCDVHRSSIARSWSVFGRRSFVWPPRNHHPCRPATLAAVVRESRPNPISK